MHTRYNSDESSGFSIFSRAISIWTVDITIKIAHLCLYTSVTKIMSRVLLQKCIRLINWLKSYTQITFCNKSQNKILKTYLGLMKILHHLNCTSALSERTSTTTFFLGDLFLPVYENNYLWGNCTQFPLNFTVNIHCKDKKNWELFQGHKPTPFQTMQPMRFTRYPHNSPLSFQTRTRENIWKNWAGIICLRGNDSLWFGSWSSISC